MADVVSIGMNREAEAEVTREGDGCFGTAFEISGGRQYHHMNSAAARLAAYLARLP
jgi:hypothetical protein